jgi:uncharacterized protein (TIGR03435 family)
MAAMRGLFVTAFGVILAVVVSAQNLSAPEFDVVSIKRNTTTDPRSFETKTTGSQITSTNVSLRALIYRAYDITADTPVLGLPPWAASERYDIIAKAAAPPTQPQSRQMWRALLADRMKFVAHMETREQQVFNLVVVRGDRTLGAGLTRSTLTCNQPSGPPADFLYQMRQTAAQVAAQPRPASPDPRKALITPEATARTLQSCSRISSGNSLVAGSMTMAALANFLTVPVERLVIDKTGLDGPFAIQMLAPSNEEGGSLFTALREQLGLSLEPARVQAPALIVDRIERPTAN